MNAIVFDIESNDLYPYQTQTWTICLKRVGGESLTLNPFKSTKGVVKQAVLDFIFKYPDPIVVGHNILGFDCWVLWKDFGINIHVGKDTICGRSVAFFDTLFASQFLYPDRDGGHSLRSWGDRFGNFKIDYRSVAIDLGIIQPNENEFCRWSPQMDEYCLQDVALTEQVFLSLYNQIEETNAFKLGQKNFFLMKTQEFTGFKFDTSKALDLQAKIEGMIADLKAEVEPDLPKRKLKKSEEGFYTVPAKPYLKNGQFSSHMESFVQRHNAEVISLEKIRVNGQVFPVVPGQQVIDGLPMSLSDQKELKEYFLSIGWEPSMWNVKKDVNGKPIRIKNEIVRTSPKIQENGKICENLAALDGELPQKIVRFLSLRNRLSVLTGWLESPRLKWDGRLPAGASGIASCFTSDTTILTDNGMRTWFQLNKGDLVITHKNNLKPITDVFVNGYKEVFEVTLENGIKTKLTANHPLYTNRGEFVKVEDIQIGDFVMAYPSCETWGQWRDTEIMVSTWGRVKNLSTSCYLNPIKNGQSNSLIVYLNLSGKRFTTSVGRLVLETFKGMEKDNHCLHLNDLPFDNNIENLIGGKDKTNGEHRATYNTTVRSARKRKETKLDWETVKYMRNCNLTNIELSKSLNLSTATVSQIRNYKRWARHEDEYAKKTLSIIPVKVSGIVSLGKQMTYGISVKDDESHLTDGIMTHNTHRQKHTVIVNVPKAQEDVLLGKEFRSLFTVEDGNRLIGVDQAALEARCEAHWTFPFDNGERANLLISKDIHSHNAKIFFPEETKEFDINSSDFNKDSPGFKTYRSLSKNGGYCLAYGGSGKKLAQTLRKPEHEGSSLYDAYWAANPSLKQLKEKIEHEWETIGGKKWIKGIDGRRLYSRSKHSLVNLLFQSTGAIIVDYAVCLFDQKMGNLSLDQLGRPYYTYKGKAVKRVQYFHDEYGVECDASMAVEIAKIMEWTMTEAGKRLKLNVPLVGEAKVGLNWKETH